MARTAFTQLQDQIEAIRSEAFAAGYAAAMQSIREFVTKAAPGAAPAAAPARGRRAGAAAPARTGRPGRPAGTTRQRRAAATAAAAPRQRRSSGPRPQRGTNARFVEEVLHSNAPRALRPAEIRSAIQRDKGVAIAFTSIRHALSQLEARRVAEQVDNSKTWRYTAGASN